MRIDIITIFPKMFKPVLGESMIKRAQNKGKVEIHIHNLRDYSLNKHKKERRNEQNQQIFSDFSHLTIFYYINFFFCSRCFSAVAEMRHDFLLSRQSFLWKIIDWRRDSADGNTV